MANWLTRRASYFKGIFFNWVRAVVAIFITAFTILMIVRDALLDPKYRELSLLKHIPQWGWHWWTIIGLTLLLLVTFEAAYAKYRSEQAAFRKRYKARVAELRKEHQDELTSARVQAFAAIQSGESSPKEEVPIVATPALLKGQRPNLVLKRERVARTWENRITDDSKGFPIALVEFKNESDADFPVEAATVRAIISFEEVEGSDRRHISDGAWLDVRAKSFRFRLGDARELIIAIKRHEGVRTVGVVERKVRHIHTAIEFVPHPLTGREYRVEVELVAEGQSKSLSKHLFKLTTQPELHIEQV